MEEKINRENGGVYPDIYLNFDQGYNPTLESPNSEFVLQFYQTKESLVDIDIYKKFIKNAVDRFRASTTYKHYKCYLMDIGMDRCQLLPNIDVSLFEKHKNGIEMHHNFLTIFDIALMICEHVLNTTGFISTFDLVQLLKEEHKDNNVPIVMLCKTAHQIFHANQEMVIPAQACFGYWMDLIKKYNKGITLEIANKIIIFLNASIDYCKIGSDFSNDLLKLRDDILDWSRYNTYGNQLMITDVMM